jgi:hypothetical protein
MGSIYMANAFTRIYPLAEGVFSLAQHRTGFLSSVYMYIQVAFSV